MAFPNMSRFFMTVGTLLKPATAENTHTDTHRCWRGKGISLLQRKDGSCILTITYLGVTGNFKYTHVKDYNAYVVLVLLPGWKEDNIRASCYLANNFRGVSDMHHGRGDLQPREVLSFHCHLKVLLILFLSTTNIEEWEIHEASGMRV